MTELKRKFSIFHHWAMVTAIGSSFLMVAPLLAKEPVKIAGKTAQGQTGNAPKAKGAKNDNPWVVPSLPDGKTIVTDTSPAFLKPTETLKPDVAIAKSVPTIDFLVYPGQDYEGKPWSNWGDSVFGNGKYYASLGDHMAIGAKGDGSNGTGTALIFEYDPQNKTVRELVDVSEFLNMPQGHYTPGKVHGRMDMGSDGWLYYSTHRGSAKATTDEFHFKGDWIFRTNPQDGKTEIVAHGPVPKHCIPNSVLDADRMIFYGATAAGSGGDEDGIQLFAYDAKNKKMLYSGDDGPSRYMMFARSTGRLYYTPGKEGKYDGGQLMRYHPDENGGKPMKLEGKTMGIRAATQETPDGFIYAVSMTGKADRAAGTGAGSNIYRFNTKTEEIENMGSAAVGRQTYIASLDADPTGRYLYYIPGAHGGSQADGSAVVQFDTQTRQKKVIAFLHPYYMDKYGFTMAGTFSSALDEKGETLYITWNMQRAGAKSWDTVGMTAIHIPESERQP